MELSHPSRRTKFSFGKREGGKCLHLFMLRALTHIFKTCFSGIGGKNYNSLRVEFVKRGTAGVRASEGKNSASVRLYETKIYSRTQLLGLKRFTNRNSRLSINRCLSFDVTSCAFCRRHTNDEAAYLCPNQRLHLSTWLTRRRTTIVQL